MVGSTPVTANIRNPTKEENEMVKKEIEVMENKAYKTITEKVQDNNELKTESKKEKNIVNNKTLWVNLIKKSNCQALSSDVIEGCKDLTEEIVREICELVVSKGKKEIEVDDVKAYIEKNIKNKDTEIDKNCVFSPSAFLNNIENVLKSFECTISPETVFLLQTFVESLLVKMLNGAELVREASKRKRVFATDLLISYQIHKM